MKWPVEESRFRNGLLVAAGVVTFAACVERDYRFVVGGLFLVLAALWWAVRFDVSRALFVTAHPEVWPPGAMWRRWTVTDVRADETGRWVVFGRRAW
jgi:hypothetical protein